MCGIYFSYSDRRFPQSEQEVNLSMQKIKHRGQMLLELVFSLLKMHLCFRT